MNKNSIPIYELVLDKHDELTGVDTISLVDCPAINRNFMKFSKEQRFNFNNEKHILTGPAMIPDSPIYRSSAEYGEHYVKFSRKTIEDIVKRYFKNENNLNWNLQHQFDTKGVYLFESYIINRKNGVSPSKMWSDLPDGTWMVSVKIEDDDIWEGVKNGDFNGFSVECNMGYSLPETDKSKFSSDEVAELKMYKDFYKMLCKI